MASNQKYQGGGEFNPLNVRGLNSPFKRSKVLEFLKKGKMSMWLSYLRLIWNHPMQNKHYRVITSSEDGSKTKGVIILIKRRLNLAIDKISSNNSRRLAYCGVSIQGK